MKKLAFVFVAMLALGACGTPYKDIALGYNTLDQTKNVVEGLDRSFKVYGASEHERCAKAHGTKTPEYNKCTDKTLDFLATWTGMRNGVDTGKGILPAIQTAQAATKRSLDAAFDFVRSNEAACKKKDAPKACRGDWKVLLQPVGCAAMEMADRGVKIGAINLTENQYYKMAKAFVAWALGCGGTP